MSGLNKTTILFLLILISHFSYGQIYKTGEFESVATAPIPSIIFPKFKGGKKGLDQYLKDNVNVPNSLSELDRSGVIVISYKISSKGKIEDIKVDKANTTMKNDFHSLITQVLQSSGPWENGTKSGKPFSARLQISFSFEE